MRSTNNSNAGHVSINMQHAYYYALKSYQAFDLCRNLVTLAQQSKAKHAKYPFALLRPTFYKSVESNHFFS